MKHLLSLLVLSIPLIVQAGEPTDARLGKPKDLNGYFPFKVPASKDAWETRRRELREQILVANGLWPMPEKMPLSPVIHGKIERDGYTIEKVFFASMPGHYVSGNLYKPTGLKGKAPAVLCPHGHWANGRLFELSNAKTIEQQIQSGAEGTKESAMYPLQARCAQLARMGCVVFFYDMVGNADSQPIVHRQGFTDVDAEMRLQNFMGLQTFNSIRALDFLLSLPEVDAKRVGVTGASGGGTQTFILCGVDDRPAAAFPAVMVGTAMQGGCVCENASYLRVGTGNVEIAGLFGPKPLGMSGANDWTKDIETKGLPELKVLYKMLGADGNVMAKTHIEFGHNYNQVSREIMYNFFNKHLALGQTGTIKEQPFKPVPPKELSVYDEKHPRPKDAHDATALRRTMTERADKQLDALVPKDAKGAAEFQRIFGRALRVMMNDKLPPPTEVTQLGGQKENKDGVIVVTRIISRKGAGETVRVQEIGGRDFAGPLVVWVHPDGLAGLWQDGKLTPAARKVIEQKAGIMAVEVLRTGATAAAERTPVNKNFAGFTFGYNRTLLAERVHDILTAVAFAKAQGAKTIHLVGEGSAGPWVALARGLCGDAVARTAADLNGFRFEQVKGYDDDMMMPGGLKYGGLLTLAGLAAPHELYLHNLEGAGSARFLEAAYQSAGAAKNLQRQEKKADASAVVGWLLR